MLLQQGDVREMQYLCFGTDTVQQPIRNLHELLILMNDYLLASSRKTILVTKDH